MELKRSVLLPYTAEDMFDLIEAAEQYPHFLPWCTSATILERSDDWVAARIEFSYLKLRFGFQTRNRKQRPDWLQVRMVEGPFRNFLCDWALVPLGGLGCRVSLSMSFDVADGRLDALAGPAAGLVSKAMVDAFVKRAAATLQEASMKEFAKAQVATAPAAHTGAPEPTAQTAVTALTHTPLPHLETLRASPLARELSAEQVAVLATVVRSEHFAAGAVLAQEGAADNHLYVVTAGSLAVVKGAGTPDEMVLMALNPGEFAHELGFLDGAERYGSLVAPAGAEVLVLEREGLERLVDSHPRVAYGVMRSIVRVVHRAQANAALQTAELTNYIVKQHGRY